MKKFNNLQDLFHHQLKDIYSAEKQLIGALPTMEEKASNNGLKNAFQSTWLKPESIRKDWKK